MADSLGDYRDEYYYNNHCLSFLKNCIFMSMGVLPVWISEDCIHAYIWRLKEVVDPWNWDYRWLWAAVCARWGPNPSPLKEQRVLLTAKLSLQLLHIAFLTIIWQRSILLNPLGSINAKWYPFFISEFIFYVQVLSPSNCIWHNLNIHSCLQHLLHFPKSFVWIEFSICTQWISVWHYNNSIVNESYLFC